MSCDDWGVRLPRVFRLKEFIVDHLDSSAPMISARNVRFRGEIKLYNNQPCREKGPTYYLFDLQKIFLFQLLLFAPLLTWAGRYVCGGSALQRRAPNFKN